jgi:hypothetical protein
MPSASVNIAYRPLRICWVIPPGDLEAFRVAVRANHALWGGRYNPIVATDSPDARDIVRHFRVDFVHPARVTEETSAFIAAFPHLVRPVIHDEIFVTGEHGFCSLLDVENALESLRDTPDLSRLRNSNPAVYSWDETDPLADIFRILLGEYPSKDESHTDYLALYRAWLDPSENRLAPGSTLPPSIFEQPSIAYLARHGLERHYSIHSIRDRAAIYLGRSNDLNDLLSYWNLRAADMPLLFVDLEHHARSAEAAKRWIETLHQDSLAREDSPGVGVWYGRGTSEEQATRATEAISVSDYARAQVTNYLWNGLNLAAPMMFLGEGQSLGQISTDHDVPRLSFELTGRPYSKAVWFHPQHLVASVAIIGALYREVDFLFEPPFVPELNQFYGREMLFEYSAFRIEPERLGIVVDAHQHSAFLTAVSKQTLVQRIFSLAGYDVKTSAAGLIARQLLAQLGGAQGARVFKIPGARRLLRTFGPTAAFSRNAALQLIGRGEPGSKAGGLTEHADLYLEPRPEGKKLDAAAVFNYLVRKGLFRLGCEIKCDKCQLTSWYSVDDLSQRVACQLCGYHVDATGQLVEQQWTFRRSGVLGLERNAQGSIPVLLTLQQLDTNLSRGWGPNFFELSLDLLPNGAPDRPRAEVDFVWVVSERHSDRTAIVLGECKDGSTASGSQDLITHDDIEKLRAVADGFPRDRFRVYVLFAKLADFSSEEIALVERLNTKYEYRAILLTAKELDPYFLPRRGDGHFDGSFSGLARMTHERHWTPKSVK